MNRLTKILNNDYFIDNSVIQHTEKGYSGDAIDKLAKFENIYEDLLKKQEIIIIEIDKLHSEGKNGTVKFKQLLANKLTNKNILAIFEIGGL